MCAESDEIVGRMIDGLHSIQSVAIGSVDQADVTLGAAIERGRVAELVVEHEPAKYLRVRWWAPLREILNIIIHPVPTGIESGSNGAKRGYLEKRIEARMFPGFQSTLAREMPAGSDTSRADRQRYNNTIGGVRSPSTRPLAGTRRWAPLHVVVCSL